MKTKGIWYAVQLEYFGYLNEHRYESYGIIERRKTNPMQN